MNSFGSFYSVFIKGTMTGAAIPLPGRCSRSVLVFFDFGCRVAFSYFPSVFILVDTASFTKIIFALFENCDFVSGKFTISVFVAFLSNFLLMRARNMPDCNTAPFDTLLFFCKNMLKLANLYLNKNKMIMIIS